MYSTPAKKLRENEKIEPGEISEIIFEQAEEDKNTTFEVHENIHDSGEKNKEQELNLDQTDMFDLRRERPSNTFLSPVSMMFKKSLKHVGGTIS